MTAISIIIPCYNEEANLKRGVLEEVAQFLSTQKFTYEVIVGNDQSTDQSLNLIKKFCQTHSQFKVYDLPKGGKPGALWHSLDHVQYPLVLFTDMDQSTPLKEINKLLPYFKDNFDIVIGSRGQDREGTTPLRLLGSRVFAGLRNFLLHTHITDTQCGFKAMRTDIARQLFPRLEVIKNIQQGQGWRVTAYDVELLFIAQKLGYKIKEVPVVWRNEDISVTKGDVNARYVRESKQMAQEVWRIFLNNLSRKYESA